MFRSNKNKPGFTGKKVVGRQQPGTQALLFGNSTCRKPETPITFFSEPGRSAACNKIEKKPKEWPNFAETGQKQAREGEVTTTCEWHACMEEDMDTLDGHKGSRVRR